MSKKKIMRSFKINEISAVDQPAQAGARMSIMKRSDQVLKGSALTSNVEGHSHLIYCLDEGGGTTSYSQMSGEDCGHSHPYIITQEGTIVIGESEGHSHEITAYGKSLILKEENGNKFPHTDYALVGDINKVDTWKLRLTDTPGGIPDLQSVNVAVAELSKLSKEECSAAIHRVEKAWLILNPDKTQDDLVNILKAKPCKTKKETDMEEIDKLKAELAKATKLAELTDIEKAHYNSLDDSAKESFLAKSTTERKELVTKAADSDPVVYKAADGVEYRKSAGDTVINLVKKNDELAKGLATEKAARENADLEKRAEVEFKNLPGTTAEKAALLKSLESIPDESIRKNAIAAVKAGDTAISGAFVRKGAGGGSSVVVEGSATDQLDKLAKKHAEEHKVPYHKAYSAVIETTEGKQLYEQTLK